MDVLLIVLPIYLLMGIGYLSARRRVFSPEGLAALGTFTSHYALPALLFSTLATRDLRAAVEPTYLLVFALGAVLLIGVGVAWGRAVWRQDLTAAAFTGMGFGCSNSSFVGLPLLLLVLPESAALALGHNVIVESAVLFPLILTLAELGRGSGKGLRALGSALRQVLRNPIVVGVLAGAVVGTLGIPLPTVVVTTLGFFGSACTVLAIFYGGALLSGLELRSVLGPALTVPVAKLVVLPALTVALILAAQAIGLPALSADMRAALVLMTGMPVFTMWVILAAPYGAAKLASAALALTMVLSLGTVSVLIILLRAGGWLAA